MSSGKNGENVDNYLIVINRREEGTGKREQGMGNGEWGMGNGERGKSGEVEIFGGV